MKNIGFAHFAAALVSLTMCMSAGFTVSADDFQEPSVVAQTVDKNGNIGKVKTDTASLSLKRSSVTLSVGSSYTVKPLYDSEKLGNVSFSSRNKKIAEVSKGGKITAVSAGKTYITCRTEDGSSASVKVTVTEEQQDVRRAENVFFIEDSHTLRTGEVWHAYARVAPKGCTYNVRYTSSDKNVATVVKTGDITAVGPGVCTITITTDNDISDTIEITVVDPKPEISFVQKQITLEPGEKAHTEIYSFPENAEFDIKYSSSDKSVAKVSAAGTVLAIAPGYAKITASCGEITSELDVIVTGNEMPVSEFGSEFDRKGDLLPSEIEFADSSGSLMVGEKIRPEIRYLPVDAVFAPSFNSSDPSVASVSLDGEITAVGEGTALITAVTENGKSDSFYVTVYRERHSGIDVSKWQGDIDWAAVSKNPNVEFVMIRSSFGQEDVDKKLDRNVKGCEKYNIPYGFYHYLYAETVEEAAAEADFFLSVIKDYHPLYPLVLDIEEPFYQKMSKQEVTDIVCTFMSRIENAGYYGMVYSFAKFYDDCLIHSRVSSYDNWVACWGSVQRLNENFSHPYGMWQYSETGQINGIPENVDLNYCYQDYPYIIKKYHLNNT